MNLLDSLPLNIKNLLSRLEKNNNYNNNELILSRFYSLNSEDKTIIKIFDILNYDRKLNKFKEPINIKNLKTLFLKEYLPENLQEENYINPSQSSNSSFKKDVNDNIISNNSIKNCIHKIKTPPDLMNENFNHLLTNSLKNDNFNFSFINNSLSSNKEDNNINLIENDNKEKKKSLINNNLLLEKKKKREKKEFKKIFKQKKIKNPKKINFGLKEISSKVIEIIKREKQTSYKEISDEIINNLNESGTKDEKNIRRRIYDSLNVMKSIHLFSKEKKTKKIFWNGKKEFQNEIDYNDIYNINKEIEKFSNEISLKKETINNLLEQYKSINYIIERNKLMDHSIDENKKIYCPFIFFEIPNVEKDSSKKEIRVLMNENKNKIHIAFNSKLQLYGDLDAIKKLNNNLKI
jgi:hypothetical protein